METIPGGFTFRYQDRLYHIVLAFQDGEDEETMYVVKYYGKHKQWWHYEVISHSWIEDILKRQSK